MKQQKYKLFIKHQQRKTSSKRVCPFVWELAKQYETQSLITMGPILGRFSAAACTLLARQILCGFRNLGDAEAETGSLRGLQLCFLSVGFWRSEFGWLDRGVRSPWAQKTSRVLEQGTLCRGQPGTTTRGWQNGAGSLTSVPGPPEVRPTLGQGFL